MTHILLMLLAIPPNHNEAVNVIGINRTDINHYKAYRFWPSPDYGTDAAHALDMKAFPEITKSVVRGDLEVGFDYVKWTYKRKDGRVTQIRPGDWIVTMLDNDGKRMIQHFTSNDFERLFMRVSIQ